MSNTEARRKRGVVRRSITNLHKRLAEIEGSPDHAEAHQYAQRLSSRLTGLDTEFKAIQYNILSTKETKQRLLLNKRPLTSMTKSSTGYPYVYNYC